MKSVREHFLEFDRPNYYSRVDSTHILNLHIGLDDSSNKCIEFRTKKFDVKRITSTTVIEVGQFKNSKYYTVRFTLLKDEFSDLFYTFCEDLIEKTRELEDESTGYQAIISRYLLWKKMFVSNGNGILTEPQIMGLIGEILFLRDDLGKRIGITKALMSWSGQELTHKDFSFNDTWFEIKTITTSTTAVSISSLEQLDSENIGELVVFSLEKMSEVYNGITLNNLILKTAELFSTVEERDLFYAKVSMQGYQYNPVYDSFVYELSSVSHYLVDKSFPRITKSDVDTAIIKASYSLSLTELKKHEIKE